MQLSDRTIIKAALNVYRKHLVGLESKEIVILETLKRVKELQKEY